MSSSIVMRYYTEDVAGESDERDGIIEIEVNEAEVDLIAHPRRVDALTYSLSIEEAWRLARELVRAACEAERWDES